MGDRPVSGATKPTLRARLRARLKIPWRGLLGAALALSGVALVVVGIGLIYLPAGVIAGGIALVALAFYDQTKAGRITWPR